MGLESGVQPFENKHESLDYAVREMMKVVAGTHEVVTLILREQLEVRKDLIELRGELNEFHSEFIQFQKETRDNFSQMEQLIRQVYRKH